MADAEEYEEYGEHEAVELPLFDPALYPRSYGASPGWRLVILGCSAVIALGAFCGLALFDFSPLLNSTPVAALFLIALFALFLGLGLYGLLYGFQFRVTLAANYIELVEPFRRRSLQRGEILGRRVLPGGQGFSVLVLVSRHAGHDKLKFPVLLKPDKAFWHWFYDLTDLELSEVFQSRLDIEETFRPELPAEERSRQVTLLRRLGAAFNAVTIALLGASFVLPDSGLWLLATIAALPWVAIVFVACFQPLYRFAARRNDERVDMILPLISPGLILTAHAVSTLNTVGWQKPLVLACAGGLALTGASARIDPWLRQQRWAVLIVGLFACIYGYAVGLEINALADRSAPQVYRVKVLSKEESESSHVKSWDLTLEPWGPVSDRETVNISEAEYQRIRPGDAVCVELRAGALQVTWYRVGHC
jgi:hypothetical protein